MTRQQFVQFAFVAMFFGAAAWPSRAWSQAASDAGSLSDRIRNFQRGWDGSAATSDDPNGTAPVPNDAGSNRQYSTNPAAQSGLPQISAKSLIPSNLFGRPSASAANENAAPPTPIHPRSAASKTQSSTTNQNSAPQATVRPRVRSSQNSVSSNSPAAPSTQPPQKLAANPDPMRFPSEIPAEPVAPSASPVRGSPGAHAPMNFDPEALRNDLAGAFPAPTGDASGNNVTNDKSNGNATSTDSPAPAHASSNHRNSSPVVPPAENEPTSHQPFPTVGDLLGHRPNSTSKTVNPDGDTSSAGVRDAGSKAFKSNSTSRAAAKPSPITINAAKSSESAAGHFGEKSATTDDSTPESPGVLATNRAPVIITDMEGPKQITIGREASYHLRLRNDGATAADDFVATISIPEGVEAVNSSATRGNVRQAPGSEGKPSGTLEWQIQRLEPQAAETLTLRLIPHESRPLELGVTWTHAPVGSHTIVEVQEPKLKMQIAGPDEVLFGKAQTYRLLLSNPGTGIAENVKVDLVPPGGKPGSATTHRLGDLAPGASKNVEVELTAREAGKLNIKAVASAEGGLNFEATKDLFCRKPELEVDWRGPATQYAGTAATYFFRVRNPGTANAEDVAVHVNLPEGAEFVSASEGQTFDPDRGEVLWRVGSLRPGDDCFMELKCTVRTAGENQLKIAAATAVGDLTDSKLATTNVVALADLKLDVSDPPGPIPVGEDAVYEIHVVNRGNNAAQDVNVVALFSDGLEPEAVDGSQYAVADGRVTFRSIDKIPAGQNVTLRIHTRAMKPGTHVFRAEVLCKDLDIKLAAEETTRFYQDEVTRDGASGAESSLGAKHTETVR